MSLNTAEEDDVVSIHVDESPSRSRNRPENLVKEATSSGLASHDISFKGLAGTIFIILLVCLSASVVSFSAVGWVTHNLHDDQSVQRSYGLWESCECSKEWRIQDSWFKAVQAMMSIGLIGCMAAMAFIILYMCACVPFLTKTRTIMLVMGACFFTALFQFIGITVFGASVEDSRFLSWAYGIAVVATALSLLAGCLSLQQLHKATNV